MDTPEIVNNSFVEDELPAEVEIIGISFRGSTKIYYFAANGNVAKDGDNAIVETARGLEYGKVTLVNSNVTRENLVLPLKNVIRIADKNDDLRYEANREKEKEAFDICAKKIIDHKLDMKLIDVEYTFDNTKLLFYFTSDDRVDFRELVKDLASHFRTRIELRQIGIRDEAKIMGGLGICGRPFCCNTFLPDFVQVSIKMAKEQNLSLNSAKISGACGRLMCCLRYEYDTYQEEARRMPKVDTTVVTPDGVGTVTEVKVLLNTVKVVLENDNEKTPKVYHLSVLKPYDKNAPAAQQKTVVPSDKDDKTDVSDKSHEPVKKENKEQKNNRQNKNLKKAPKPNDVSDDKTGEKSSSPVEVPEDSDKNHAKQSRNQNGKRPNRHGNQNHKRDKGENPEAKKPDHEGVSKKGLTKPMPDNTPKTDAKPKVTEQPKPKAPEQQKPKAPEQDMASGKRNYAPMPSNSIKRAGGGRFGNVKTRPAAFGKKDNSEKK